VAAAPADGSGAGAFAALRGVGRRRGDGGVFAATFPLAAGRRAVFGLAFTTAAFLTAVFFAADFFLAIVFAGDFRAAALRDGGRGFPADVARRGAVFLRAVLRAAMYSSLSLLHRDR
jgi:hypothetical protein